MPQTKQFTDRDYQKYNGIGVRLVEELFSNLGYEVQPFKEEKSKKDLIVLKGHRKYKVEAERRTREAKYPISTFISNGKLYYRYDTLNVLQRKQVTEWDFYSQCMDCYNFDSGEQTFVIATIHNSALKNMSTKATNCTLAGKQITEDEDMGKVDIQKVLWTFLDSDDNWTSISVTHHQFGDVNRQFIREIGTWKNLLGE